MKRLQSGRWETDNDFEHGIHSGYFVADIVYTFWAVKTSLIGKPYYVMPEDLTLVSVDEKVRLPYCHYDRESKYYKEYITYLKKETKDWPRDEKGRWKKEELSDV